MYWRWQEDSQFMEILDAYGNPQFVEREGTLQQVRHDAVLSALSLRVTNFRRNNQSSNNNQQQQLRNYVIDETGTIPIGLTLTREEPTQEEHMRAQIQEEMAARSVLDEILQIHGTAPGSKQEGVFRLIYENANGIDCRQLEGHKIRKARGIHDKLEADVVAYNNVGTTTSGSISFSEVENQTCDQ